MTLLRKHSRQNNSRTHIWDELIALDSRVASSNNLITINAQTGTTYTLVITDIGNLITMNNANANTLTIPPEFSVAFDIGTQILVEQEGTGVTTIEAALDVTLHSAGALVDLASQYSTVTLIKKATDTWLVVGDLA